MTNILRQGISMNDIIRTEVLYLSVVVRHFRLVGLNIAEAI